MLPRSGAAAGGAGARSAALRAAPGIRKWASAGSSIRAPNIFQRNMKASKMPISAWNLIDEKIQVATAIARVTPVRITTRPVNCSAWW
jgi:hypothetical protein